MSLIKPYSEISFAIDLVSHTYQTTNPIIIAEKCEEDLDIFVTIHQVMDYFEIERFEDYEKEDRIVQYHTYY